MKILFSFLLFLSMFSAVSAQKINRQYSFYPQEIGNVYFIHPQKGFLCQVKETKKDLQYDITYISGQDSASFTFSYYTQNVMTIDSVIIKDVSGKKQYVESAKTLFVQPKKNYWQQRVSVNIPYTLLVELYQQDTPFILTLVGGKELTYEMKRKNWQKQSALVSKIFDVVKYNQ